jgi:hypothetical protein
MRSSLSNTVMKASVVRKLKGGSHRLYAEASLFHSHLRTMSGWKRTLMW